ncbi:MAG: hypothetical protein JWQ49_2534 [Edaphobacter sp.]|nr:hypothetical protein [Edaphobacter sp.]
MEVTILAYWAYYENKSREKINERAFSSDATGMLRSMMSAPITVDAHGDQLGIDDGELIVKRYGCNGAGTRQLFSNILHLAEDRNFLPPDVPNDEFYRAQLGSGVKVEFVSSDQDAATMRLHRKSCENQYQDVMRYQESFCRCQARMLVRSGVPRAELVGLQSKFNTSDLDSLASRHSSYAQLRRECYNY